MERAACLRTIEDNDPVTPLGWRDFHSRSLKDGGIIYIQAWQPGEYSSPPIGIYILNCTSFSVVHANPTSHPRHRKRMSTFNFVSVSFSSYASCQHRAYRIQRCAESSRSLSCSQLPQPEETVQPHVCRMRSGPGARSMLSQGQRLLAYKLFKTSNRDRENDRPSRSCWQVSRCPMSTLSPSSLANIPARFTTRSHRFVEGLQAKDLRECARHRSGIVSRMMDMENIPFQRMRTSTLRNATEVNLEAPVVS